MKKYDINDFYVGKLVLLFNYDDLTLSELTLAEKKRQMEKFDVVINGAIDINNSFDNFNYNNILSIFYKKGNDFYCLHNGEKYQKDAKNIDYCDNMIPLVELLPKLDYYIPSEISFHDALVGFDYLFKNKGKFHYNKTEFDIDNFCFGEIIMCISSKIAGHIPTYYNLAQYKMLSNANLKIRDNYKVISDDNIEYNYSLFKSLFYKKRGNELYNLNDNQVYLINNGSKKINSIVKSLKPLKKELEENSISYEKDYISIPKALNLTKKIY